MPARPWFIGSEIYRHSRFGARHPLSIPRVSTVMDLVRALGWLSEDVYVDSPRATPAELARFHDPVYIEALIAAEEAQAVTPVQRERFNLGTIESPIYPEMFRRPATACGASLRAADLVRDGGIVHNPAGGTHHGRRDRASGFCFFNDPVLGLLRLLDNGLDRVLYVDIDAHHGDGVEAAFFDDPRVLTISVHEDGRWPRSGAVGDRGTGYARNLPVPKGFNDVEMAFILDAAILPLADRYRPQAVMIQCGADALLEDPLSGLGLSNNAHAAVVEALAFLTPRTIVTGGGGYNPWSVGRCWTRVWGVLNRMDIPDRLPPSAEAVLRALTWNRAAGRNPPEHWFTTLVDSPRPGPVREEVRAAVAAVTASPYPVP
ncbi:MAG: acetoin utilization protein AcuC [Rhodospirillaceae bacterium]|nr:acetoin utilization protein AcuC [Rhodospirillaceae bacterium]